MRPLPLGHRRPGVPQGGQEPALAAPQERLCLLVHRYPYWYTDTNGKVDADELRQNNPYKAYTSRLSQAVYNDTYTLRDPGAAYHNGRYTLQRLYDSLESLAQSQKAAVNMRGKVRP